MPQRRVRLFAGHARDQDAGGGREHQGRDLRDQPVADGEQAIALHRPDQLHVLLTHADGHAAQDVDGGDQEGGDGVALDELHGAVHRAVELALAAERAAPSAGLVAVDGPRAQLGVDGHLLSGHGIQREASAHLGHALGPLGNHHELDDRQDQEDHPAHHVVTAHHEGAERADHLAGVGLEQDQARAGHVERQSHQRGEQEQGGEGRDAQRVADVEGDQQDGDRERQVRGDQQIEQPGGQRHDHQPDDRHHQRGQCDLGGGEAFLLGAKAQGGGCSHGDQLGAENRAMTPVYSWSEARPAWGAISNDDARPANGMSPKRLRRILVSTSGLP